MCQCASRARVFDRDPICGEHYGQRPCKVPHQQAGHMAAPTSSASEIKTPLTARSRPHMAHFHRAARSQKTSEDEGDADILGAIGPECPMLGAEQKSRGRAENFRK